MHVQRRRSWPRLGLLVGILICVLFGLSGGSALAQAPPAPTITSGPLPGSSTNNRMQTFEFRAQYTSTMFSYWECRVDVHAGVPTGYSNCGSLARCPPPADMRCGSFTTTLLDGPHSFDVHICEPGVCGPDARVEFTIDTMAPDTVITSPARRLTNHSAPTLTFGSTEPNSTFRCRHDRTAFVACSSPHTLPALADGDHSFDVYAIDSAGNADLSPAHAAFRVDTVAPVPRITGGPAGTVDDPSPTFIFGANERPVRFGCRIDDVRFTACASPFTPASALSSGRRIFEVRAIDAAGNRGPAARLFFRVAARRGGTGLPAPSLRRTVNLEVPRGRVRVRRPGSRSFIELTGDTQQVPVRSQIDTRRGTIRLTSARDAAGETQTAAFSLGVFRVRQSRKGRPSTDVVIKRPRCARMNAALARTRATRLRLKTVTAPAAAAAKAPVIRDRPSAARGARKRKARWKVKGKYSIAASYGTKWTTIERCKRTTTVVREGRVRVFDRVRRRTIFVRAPHRYASRARR
jgi:hypothetical protein